MLTVKLVEDSGHEQIFEVKNVWTCEDDPTIRVRATLREKSDVFGDVVQFGSNGTLYVMNDGGHTIAKYPLGVNKS